MRLSFDFVLLAELLITQLFDPDSTLNPEHRPKYIGLLAYACSVAETSKKVNIHLHEPSALADNSQLCILLLS